MKTRNYVLAACLALHFVVAASEPSSCRISLDYLLWFIKKNPLPAPLLTSASYADPIPGALGEPGTHVLLGQGKIPMGWINGFRVGIGGSVGNRFEIEGTYFLLPRVLENRSFRTSGEPGAPNFAVPIFDVTGVCGLNGVPGETVFILPGPLAGSPGFLGTFNFRIASKLQGAESNMLFRFLNREFTSLRALFGLRWVELTESLLFKANSQTVDNVSFPGGFFNFSDQFTASNQFLAAQFGFDGRYQNGRWISKAQLKGALGAVLQESRIKGSSQTSGGNLFFETQGTANAVLPGGIFAEPSNRGKHHKNSFASAFEARADVGYKCTRNLQIDLGYTFFWLSRVARPGNQIDRKINTTRTALAEASRNTVGTGSGPIPFGAPGPAPAASGPKRPSSHLNKARFYAQGIHAGIALEF